MIIHKHEVQNLKLFPSISSLLFFTDQVFVALNPKITSHFWMFTIWLFNSSPWKDPPMFKNGKPSISMGHLYHGYVSHNQMVLPKHSTVPLTNGDLQRMCWSHMARARCICWSLWGRTVLDVRSTGNSWVEGCLRANRQETIAFFMFFAPNMGGFRNMVCGVIYGHIIDHDIYHISWYMYRCLKTWCLQHMMSSSYCHSGYPLLLDKLVWFLGWQLGSKHNAAPCVAKN